MKTSELMIGDWVEMNLSPSVHKYYFKAQIVVSNLVSLEANFDFDAKPIPLTEEILKANGWNKNGAYNDYILRGDIDDFIGYNADNKHVRINIDGWNAKQEVYVSANFVHELQHALRLCGLNDFADNFKVNI